MTKTACRKYKNLLRTGRVLAIDPSSGSIDRKSGTRSEAGWAVFEAGQLAASGIIQIEGSNVKQRLESLVETLTNDFEEAFDVLVIEDIWGYIASKTLVHAAGLFIAHIKTPYYVEMNVKTWQGIATRLGVWTKSDENDAIFIGIGAMVTSTGYIHKSIKRDADRVAKLGQIAAEWNYWGIEEMQQHFEGE